MSYKNYDILRRIFRKIYFTSSYVLEGELIRWSSGMSPFPHYEAPKQNWAHSVIVIVTEDKKVLKLETLPEFFSRLKKQKKSSISFTFLNFPFSTFPFCSRKAFRCFKVGKKKAKCAEKFNFENLLTKPWENLKISFPTLVWIRTHSISLAESAWVDPKQKSIYICPTLIFLQIHNVFEWKKNAEYCVIWI